MNMAGDVVQEEADRLFVRSKMHYGCADRKISVRTFRIAQRAGLVTQENEIDPHKLEIALRDGSIWTIHNVGEKAVMEFCVPAEISGGP